MHYLQKYHSLSERASHGLLGESPDGPYTNATPLQRTLAHGLGYATSPMLYGMERVSAHFSGGKRQAETAARHKPQPKAEVMPPKKQMPKRQQGPGKPKKQQQQRKQKQQLYRKPGQKQNNKKATNFGMGKQQLSQVAAPVAMGSVGHSGYGFNFTAGSRPGCLVIRGWNYMGSVVNLRYTGTAQTAVGIYSGGGNIITQWLLMPQNQIYFTGSILDMTKMFSRFRVKVRAQYRPTSPTTTPGMIMLAYYPDAMSIYMTTGKTGRENTFGDSLNKFDIGGAPWQSEGSVFLPFTTKWTYFQKDQDYAYVAAPSYTLPLNPATTTMYDMRSTNCGVIALTQSGLLPNSTDNSQVQLGELWCQYELELCDMLSTIATVTPSLKFNHDTNVMYERLIKRASEEQKSTAPPRAPTPTPSPFTLQSCERS